MKRKLVKKASGELLGLGLGAALFTVCPPAGIALGFAGFVRGARRFARTGDIDSLREMTTGYSSVAGGAPDNPFSKK